MKKGWEIKKLGDVLNIQNGYAFNSKLFTSDSGMPLIRIRDIKNGYKTEINFDGVYDNKYIVSSGDLLIGMDGEFNCCEWKGENALLNQRVCRLQDFKQNLHPRFLFYGINKYLKAIEDVTAFATVKHISSKQIQEIEFPLPPLTEQKRIVAILDKAFAAIDKAKANTEKNLQNVRELFESYLEGVFVNDVENWIEMKLKDIGVTQTGTTPKTGEKENFGNYIPFIKPADVDFSGIGDIRYDNDGLSEIGLRKGRRIECGSILMVCIGATIGKVGFSEHAVSCNQQINTLTVRKGIEPKFIYFAMTSKMFQDKVLAEGKGAQATLPIINKSKWESLTIKIPVRQSEQQSFLKKLDDLQLEVKKMEIKYKAKLAYLIELRTSILQKAFSGEL